jgi:hypothetical protein
VGRGGEVLAKEVAVGDVMRSEAMERNVLNECEGGKMPVGKDEMKVKVVCRAGL